MADQHHSDPALRTGPEEQEYLLGRAADHARQAECTADADARAIHLRLQRLYLTQADRAAMVHEA